MNADQQLSIDTNKAALVDVLEWNSFEVYLGGKSLLSDGECQVVSASGPTNGHKIIKVFSLLKWKEGSWEAVMTYLREHNYPALATKLRVDAKMETAGSQKVKSGYEILNIKINIQEALRRLAERSKKESVAQLLPDVVNLMQNYPNAGEVQLECIHLIKALVPQRLSEITVELKAHLIETMLNCLQKDFLEFVILECANTLAELKISADPIEKYTNTIDSLLKIIANPEMTSTSKRSAVWLLGGTMMASDKNRQSLVSRMGIVEPVCNVVRQKLTNHTFDPILTFCWVCLRWVNVPTVDNIDTFLDLFNLCNEKFGDELQLVEEMMNMLASLNITISNEEIHVRNFWFQENLSCFPTVRQLMVSKRNFEVLWQILLTYVNNVAISYPTVTIFTLFLSDSTIIWPLDSPTIEEATNLLSQTINKWQLDAQKRCRLCFVGIWEELKQHKSPLADLLWVWTLANYTTVYGSTYCQTVFEDGGIEILTAEVILNPNSAPDAIRLAILAVENTNRWLTSTK